jgi:RNA polymerase sigma factor for flagellar operon FliA
VIQITTPAPDRSYTHDNSTRACVLQHDVHTCFGRGRREESRVIMQQTDIRPRIEPGEGRSTDAAADAAASAGAGPEAASPNPGERLFLEHLATIRRVSAAVARQNRLSADEAEELAAVVQFRLIVDDYAVLRKFRRQCSLPTFLRVVIQRIFLDTRDAQWGKWRASAAARRHGPVAIHLERLTMRDGLTFDEACAILRRSDTTLERDTLARIYGELRVRVRPRLVAESEMSEVPAMHWAPDRPLVASEEAGQLSDAVSGLDAAMKSLSTRDRLLLQLRFADDLPVAAIARLLRLDQKWLYRRYARLLVGLRRRLESHGVTGRNVVPLIGEAAPNEACVFGLPDGDAAADQGER